MKGGGESEEEQKIGEKLNSVDSAETRERVQRRNARKQENLYFEWEERSKGTRIASPCDQKVPKTSSGRVRRMVKSARKKREKNIGRISAFFALRIGGKTANSEDKNESKEKKIDRSTSHESFVSSQRNTGLWWSIAFERRTDVLWKEAGVVPRDPFINPPVGARLPRGTHEAITPSDNSRSSIVRHRGRVRERASFSRLKKKGTYGSV